MRKFILCCFLFSSFRAMAAGQVSFDKNTFVFIGSSTIEYWSTLVRDFPSIKTLNLGKGGTEYGFLISNASKYAEKYPAKNYVIYSGDNDISNGKSPEEVAKNFRKLIEILHAKLPTTHFYVYSVKPCPAPERKAHLPQVKAADLLIRAEAKHHRYVTYLDVYGKMVDSDGNPIPSLFRNDGIHLNDTGYAIWTKALTPYLPHATHEDFPDIRLAPPPSILKPNPSSIN